MVFDVSPEPNSEPDKSISWMSVWLALPPTMRLDFSEMQGPANEEQAIILVGRERYRMWIAYLAGASVGFQAGSIKVYQILATKKAGKGRSGLPPTRGDLYLNKRDTVRISGQDVMKLLRAG